MGILNVTPDSFSDGGSFSDPKHAIEQGLQLTEEGADILDVGGESTRPGAEFVSSDEEIQRVLPVIKGLRDKTDIPISIDTTKAKVARVCLEAGADIVNDVSGLNESGDQMAALVRDYGAGLILMHRRGDAQTMQSMTSYQNVTDEIIQDLRESIEFALNLGVEQSQLVVDPGLGFAKESEHNFQIVDEVQKFSELSCPVLLGPSRKSFIGKVTGREVDDREFGTAAMVAVGVYLGAHIFRVHNVKAMRDAVLVAEAIRRNSELIEK